ncbi:MAG: DNA polymerase III subunit alpha [Rickettsiales bacterium]|nr:DNA polymerase III subunit alpha [Rickettsiales bacterium]
MNYPKFIHLRLHSSYSLSEGAIKVEEIGKLCAKNNMPAVAITDSGNLFGLLETAIYSAKSGVQLIAGVEANFTYQREEIPHKNLSQSPYNKILLLAKNEAGYLNLLKLVSDSFLKSSDKENPVITLAELQENHNGIICLTGGFNGVLDRNIRDGQKEKAEEILDNLHQIFGSRLYIELNRLGQEKQEMVEEELLRLALLKNIPIVATNNVMFATPEMYEAQDILMCIAQGNKVNDANRRRYYESQYFKSQEEMAEVFSDLPEALENSVKIAISCSFSPKEVAPMLPKFPTLGGRSDEEELRDVAFKGLCKRLNLSEEEGKNLINNNQPSTINHQLKEYFDRLEFEISVICKMEFPGYFLIVSDFIRWAKHNNIPVGPGRGSGAGSVVAYALEITNLDPLRFGLLFERFLNPERVSMPDFDIDFCQERRGEVIDYVQQKYGTDKVAQIITFGKLQARAVLRDVGRVLDIPYSVTDRICKMVPFNPVEPVTLEKAVEMDPDLQRERKSDPTIAHLIDIGLKLEGMHRHASTHAAGVVIGAKPLVEIAPLYSDGQSSMPVTQYSMKYCEAAGLVKFDFLGLKTLTLISKTIEMIKQNENVEIDIDAIPLDDKKTYEMLAEGKGVGVFQMESAGMRDSMRKMKIDSIEDIIALISLYRPGPMENIPKYIACKLGKEKPDYMHPILENCLKETYGVIIYQEQVMQIAQIMGGYTLGGADLLRRAMGKKIKSEMDAQCEKFVTGAVANKIDKKKAEEIFELVAKFAGYGFNKSHAAAYAVIGYQTAYLKAHYPAEFLACSMNQMFTDTDKLLLFREEARKLNLEVLPPNINKSSAYFIVEKTPNGKKAIRYALGALKNVGVDAMIELVKNREDLPAKKFKSITEFVNNVSANVVNKRQIESLAMCGAFDEIHENRKQIFEEAQIICKFNQAIIEERNAPQVSLFGGFDNNSESIREIKFSKISDWNDKEKTQKEFEAIGFFLENHPVKSYLKILPKEVFTLVEALEDKVPISSAPQINEETGKRIYQAGIRMNLIGVASRVVHRSRAGKRFTYFNLSDPTGMTEINIFEENLINKARDLLESSEALVVNVDARRDEGGFRIIANDIATAQDYFSKQEMVAEIEISAEQLNNLDFKTLKNNSENDNDFDRISLILNVKTENGIMVKIKLPQGVHLNRKFLAANDNLEIRTHNIYKK